MMASGQNIKCQKEIKLEDVLLAFKVFLGFEMKRNETKRNRNKSSTKTSTERASTIRGGLGYLAKNNLRGITLGMRLIWWIDPLTLIISWCLLINNSKLIDSWNLRLTIFNNCIIGSRFLLRDSWRGRSSSHQAWLDINNSLHFARKYARIFVHGHYLFREANSFPKA